MQFSKRNMAIIALVIILVASNVAFAVLYMTKNVNISGGVAAVGAIEIYEEDGVTPLTDYDFPLFTAGTLDYYILDFFVNNTGNVPVYVTWNISTSSISWENVGPRYVHLESSVEKYYYTLFEPDYSEYWCPYYDGYTAEIVVLAVGAGEHIQLLLTYLGSPTTPETFSLVMSFYAKDTTG
jgi:hypothetical protein